MRSGWKGGTPERLWQAEGPLRSPRGDGSPVPLSFLSRSREQISLSTSGHARNKRPLHFPQEAFHSGQRFDESCSHLIGPQVPARENKRPHFRRQKGGDLGLSIAEHFILGRDYPPSLAHFAEPVFIRSVGREVVLVNMDGEAVRAESLGNNPIAEGAIDEVGDGPTQPSGARARSGSLPQCLTARGRNRLPSLPLIRRR